jgi:hypothetical protein
MWHDGVARLQPGISLGVESRVVAGAWELLSVEEAFRQRERRIQIVAPGAYAADPVDWQGWWDPHWLPFAAFDASALFVDVRQVTPAETVPVRRYDHTPEDPQVVDPDSLESRCLVPEHAGYLQARHGLATLSNRLVTSCE